MWRVTIYLGEEGSLLRPHLVNLLVYYMSLLRMIVEIEDKLDCFSRFFPWGSCNDKNKLHLMKWYEVVKPKLAGGWVLVTWRLTIWLFEQSGGGDLGRKQMPCREMLLFQKHGEDG